jgi:hypothetical protein
VKGLDLNRYFVLEECWGQQYIIMETMETELITTNVNILHQRQDLRDPSNGNRNDNVDVMGMNRRFSDSNTTSGTGTKGTLRTPTQSTPQLVRLHEIPLSTNLRVFLMISFLLIPRDSLSKTWLCLYYGIVGGVIFFLVFLATAGLGYAVVSDAHSHSTKHSFGMVLSVGICIQAITIVYGVYYGLRRIARLTAPELAYADQAANKSLRYRGLLMAFMFASLAAKDWLLTATMLGNGVGISIFLFFLYIDTAVCKAQISDLRQLVELNALAITAFDDVRSNVRKVCASAELPNTIMAIVAVINTLIFIVALLVMLFVPGYGVDNNLLQGVLVLYLICIYLKETVYLFLALMEVASVNDQSMLFLHKLAYWRQGSVSSVDQMHMFMEMTLEPITFPLLWTTPTTTSVRIQFFGFMVSMVVAIVKAILSRFGL